MSLPLWYLAAFLLGLLAGAVANYCARRLPYERSLVWPGPACVKCGHPVPWAHRVPVLGYALSAGKCRGCGDVLSLREPAVELLTGALFVAMFALVSGQLPVFGSPPRWKHSPATAANLVFFAHYAVLTCFLLTASLCDLAEMEIPFSLTLLGTAVGLASSALSPWPYPHPPTDSSFWPTGQYHAYPTSSLYPWPLWEPNSLPRWLPPGSPLLGLFTGLAGAAAGTALLRGIGFLFKMGRGIDGIGVGDADLMMMAGAFVGWQVVVVAFVVAVAPGLVFGLAVRVLRRENALPFGPSLAIGVLMAVVLWPKIGPEVAFLLFLPQFLALVFGGGALALFVMALLLWVFRWLMGDEEGESSPPPEGPPPG